MSAAFTFAASSSKAFCPSTVLRSIAFSAKRPCSTACFSALNDLPLGWSRMFWTSFDNVPILFSSSSMPFMARLMALYCALPRFTVSMLDSRTCLARLSCFVVPVNVPLSVSTPIRRAETRDILCPVASSSFCFNTSRLACNFCISALVASYAAFPLPLGSLMTARYSFSLSMARCMSRSLAAAKPPD